MKQISFAVIFSIAFFSCSTKSKLSGQTEITKWQDGKRAAISITFDDATINQFRYALPILDSLGFKGTFFINTADIPGSEFPPKYFGRSLRDIVKESASKPTDLTNLFERGSALRFLNIDNAIELHNSVGSLFEQDKKDQAFHIMDSALAIARKNKEIKQVRPVLLKGEIITWDEIRNFAKNNHEFASHTISHPRLAVLDEANILYELQKSKEEILKKLGVKETFSAECPFGTENERVMQYAYKVYPALRNRMPEPFLQELNRSSKEFPGQFQKEYIQWQRGPLKKNGVTEMNSWVDTVLTHNNVWLALTFHGVEGIGWEAKPHAELRAFYAYMKTHESQLWVTPFRDATKYMRERMSANVDSKNEDKQIKIKLTHTLDQSLYDLPLTLKTYVDENTKAISVRQGERHIATTSGSDDVGTYILYQAMPNGEDIIINNN